MRMVLKRNALLFTWLDVEEEDKEKERERWTRRRAQGPKRIRGYESHRNQDGGNARVRWNMSMQSARYPFRGECIGRGSVRSK